MILIIIGLFYLLFLYVDIFNIKILLPSNMLKFLSIILCFMISLLIGKDGLSKKDRLLLQVGLFITVLADLCFLILHHYILGIILFCFVQIIYCNRYKGYGFTKSKFLINQFILIFVLILAVSLMTNFIFIKIELLYVIAFIYGICLIYSTVEVVRAFKNRVYPHPNKSMILFGMLLFSLCDTSIAIANLSQNLNRSIYHVFSLLIWVFYLPSQGLLALSGYEFKRSYGNSIR